MTRSIRLNPTTLALLNLYTTTFLGAMWGMIIPIVPLLSTHFAVSPGTAAQAITALAVGRFLGTPISGIILDRLGARAALVGGTVTVAIAALLAATTPWFGAILALLLIIGAADSVWNFGREVAGIDLARLDQRGRVLSGFHGIHNIGLALGPLIGGLLAEGLSFRAVFVAYAACAAVSVPLGLIGPNLEHPKDSLPVSRVANRWGLVRVRQWLGGLLDLFHQIEPRLRATYAALVFATLTSMIHRVTLQSMLPLYANSQLHFTPIQIGFLFSISGIFVFAMILPAGFIIDKVGRKWATVPSTGIPALVFLFIPFSSTFVQLALLMSLMGMANGLSLGSIATSTYDVVPERARGRLQALRRTLAETGAVSAPLVGGLLADAFNPGVPFLLWGPLLVLSAILLAVIARETLER